MEDSYQNLNLKLAEWAGFKLKIVRDDDGKQIGSYIVFGEYEENTTRKAFPNFPESLDAIFQWLVPKLDRITIEKTPYNTEWLAYIEILDSSTEAEAETPALALCKAIEQLIDKEK